nr:DUF1474 family protein [Staphylococcus aureus]
MKMYLTYICLVSLLTILLLAISNMYVAFSVYGMMVTYGFNLTGGLETKREHINFSASYLEHRIQNEHTVELLQVYLKEFDELIQKFHEIEKASSDVSLATESDDAKKLKITE